MYFKKEMPLLWLFFRSSLFCLLFLVSYSQLNAQRGAALPDSLLGTWVLDSIKMENKPAVSAAQLGGEVSMRFLSSGILIVQRFDAKDAFHSCTFDGKKLYLTEDRKEMEVVSLNRVFLVMRGKEDGKSIAAIYRRGKL